jgi:transcriptional regulator with XRE-family HTH domain
VENNSENISDQLLAAVLDKIKSGVSQYAICKGAEIDPATLHRWIKGDRGINVDTLDKLAAYLGLALKPHRRTRRG